MSPSELADAYLAGAAQLRAAVSGMTSEQLSARPVPRKWSTLEVVAHISDFEPVMSDRIKRVISHENPTLMGADEDLFAKHLFYCDRNIEEELAVVEAIRVSTARILKLLPPAALNRIGTHSDAGILTLELLVLRATNHITHHLKFIHEKRDALGLNQ